jgi:hypothetical protein
MLKNMKEIRPKVGIGVYIVDGNGNLLMTLTYQCLSELMLLCLLPANIYSAINRVDFGGHGAGPIYLLVPFQLFVIC